ncbi:hypothetical protein VTO73DRAFT_6714 [Trametes versicolor]
MATHRQRNSSPEAGVSVVNLDEWDTLSSLDGRPSPPGESPLKYPRAGHAHSTGKSCFLAPLGFLPRFRRHGSGQSASSVRKDVSIVLQQRVAAGMKAVKRCLLVFATPSSGSAPKQARSRMLPKLSGLMAETYECVACMTDIDVSEEQAIQVSCGHLYHSECLLQLVQVSMSSPTQFPPRCCRKPVDPLSFEHLLTPTQPPACGTLTCARCRIAVDPAPGAPVHACGHEPAHRAALRLGNTLGWVRCPECEQLVERDGGCSHMTCACGAHFCYGCGSKWQTCSCVEWRAGAGAGEGNRRQRERDLFAPLQEDEDLSGRLELWAPPRPVPPRRAQTVPMPPHDGAAYPRRRSQERRTLTMHHDGSLEIVHEERGLHPLGRADSVRMSIFTVEHEPSQDFVGSCLPFRPDSSILARGERARAVRERGTRRAATM